MSYIDLYEYCAPTPKNIVPIIIVSILYFVVFKLIKFSTASSLKASQPRPQIDSVGCANILPDLTHSIDAFKSSEFVFN